MLFSFYLLSNWGINTNVSLFLSRITCRGLQALTGSHWIASLARSYLILLTGSLISTIITNWWTLLTTYPQNRFWSHRFYETLMLPTSHARHKRKRRLFKIKMLISAKHTLICWKQYFFVTDVLYLWHFHFIVII